MMALSKYSMKHAVKGMFIGIGAFLMMAAACNSENEPHISIVDSSVTCTEGKNEPYTINLTVAESDSLITSNIDNDCFTILDVRTQAEYDQGHIAGAVLYDFNSGKLQDVLNTLEKHRMYFIYCRSGNRSAQAMSLMKDTGFTALYNMLGGFNEWVQADLPWVQ